MKLQTLLPPIPKMQLRSETKGFSLLELMISVLIVGVLAAIAGPAYHKTVVRAQRAEAESSIGTIRTQLMVYYGVNGRLPISPNYRKVVGASWNDIQAGELTGKYFQDKHFRYRSVDGVTYRIKCQKGGVLDKQRWINEKGEWGGDW